MNIKLKPDEDLTITTKEGGVVTVPSSSADMTLATTAQIPAIPGQFNATEPSLVSLDERYTSYGDTSIAQSDGEGNHAVATLPFRVGTLAMQEGIAPAFSAASTYAVGDYCTYNGWLYKCKTAVSTAGAWDSSKWMAVVVTDEMGGGGDTNNKANSTAIAPAFSTSSTYSIGDHVTYNGALYECVTTVSTAGAWDSTKWKSISVYTNLPYDAELEYIVLGNDAYIDTGIAGTNTALNFSATFKPEDSLPSSGRKNLAGIVGGSDFGIFKYNGETAVAVCLFKASATNKSSLTQWSDGQFHALSVVGTSVFVDGVQTVTEPRGSNGLSYNFYFGKASNADATVSVFYSAASLSVGETILRDFIPVRKNGVGYFYDRVSGQLFGNAGTGTIVLGPDKAQALPLMDGTAAHGSSPDMAPIDHVHPTDTTKISKTGDTMTGALTVPTITVGSRAVGSTVGVNSVAEGYSTTASGTSSHAEGSYTTASGDSSHAEGSYSTASDNSSHAEGYSTTAGGNSSHAEGEHTTASGYYSHAEGYSTTAESYASHAEGDTTAAIASASHAEGSSTVARNDSEHAQGKFNASHTGSTDAEKTIHSIGVGTANNARTNAVEVMRDGKVFIKGVGGYDGTNPTTATNLATTVAGKVDKSGDTMTGALTVPGTVANAPGLKVIGMNSESVQIGAGDGEGYAVFSDGSAHSVSIGAGGPAEFNVVDGDDDFDVALPKNTGTLALQEGIAAAFSASSTYEVGDYCTHEGLLYKCSTAVTTAGAWNAADWTAVAVTDEMAPVIPPVITVDGIRLHGRDGRDYLLYVDSYGHLALEPEGQPQWTQDEDGGVSTDGELNEDGTLTVDGELNEDGTLTVQAGSGPEPDPGTHGEMNNDGSVTIQGSVENDGTLSVTGDFNEDGTFTVKCR